MKPKYKVVECGCTFEVIGKRTRSSWCDDTIIPIKWLSKCSNEPCEGWHSEPEWFPEAPPEVKLLLIDVTFK